MVRRGMMRRWRDGGWKKMEEGRRREGRGWRRIEEDGGMEREEALTMDFFEIWYYLDW